MFLIVEANQHCSCVIFFAGPDSSAAELIKKSAEFIAL